MTIKWVSVVHLGLVLALVAAPSVGQQESSTAPASTESSVNATTPSVSGANSSESSTSPSAPSSTTLGVPVSSSTEASTTTAASAAAATTEGDASAKSTTAGAARNTSGRAFDFESDTNETTVEKGSLQDLSLDDIDMSMFMTPEPANDTMEETSMPSSTGASAPSGSAPTATSPESPSMPMGLCVEPKGTFAVGERWSRGCDENCTCGADGRSMCEPRCSLPFIRRGSRALDAECYERPSQDPCCAVMVCTHDHDTETEPVEECQFKNQTLQRGESVKDGCESVCTCGEAGTVTCKPRCAPVTNTTSDRCVAVPDTVDPCCTVVRCDVTLTDHEVVEPVSEETSGMGGRVKLTSVTALNSTAARVETEAPLPPAAVLETSVDGSQWMAAPRRQGSVLAGLKEGTTLWVRAVVANMPSNALQVALPMRQEPTEESKVTPAPKVDCTYKGANYSLGVEFHDGCEATCMCTNSGVQCADFECPSHMMMMLEPHCVQWDTDPPGFEPSPGRCCPDAVRCVHNGSCVFSDERFEHRASIPQRLTGCERRCVCDAGNLTCEEACPPTPHAPPPELPCPPHLAELDHVPGDGCCLHWTCPSAAHSTHDYAVTSVPGGFPHLPVSGQPEEVVVQTLEALDATSVRVVFSVPPVFVGLHGRIELRYTDDKNNHDPSTWKPQVLAPPQDLLATPTLEFTLGDLKPDTEYRVKITVLLRDLQNSPSSPILAVHTPPVATSTLPPVVPVSPELEAAEVNASWAVLTWRRFSDFEMQLIDGVQLRYKPLEDKVYQATPLIHRAVTSYTIENLKPSTTYEVRIFFIPFPGQASELQSDSAFQFTTKEPEDTYKFDVHMEVHHIKSTSIEVNWTGVPYPEDKYVNIYRAIYQSDSGKDFSTFSVAKRDSTASILIKDLSPGTRYRLWLEIYLTNGKIKKSNVQDFSTRPGSVDPVGSSHQGKLESSAAPVREAGDYYSPLVAVAILAALAIMATLILLLMLMKRRSQTKAAITAGRKSQSAYDNPSYKTCEDQQPAANGNGSAAPAAAAATPKAATPNAHAPAAAPGPTPQPA